MPVPRAVPSASVSDRAAEAEPCSSDRRLAQHDQGQRRVGEAHAQAGQAEERARTSHGLTSGERMSMNSDEADEDDDEAGPHESVAVGQR